MADSSLYDINIEEIMHSAYLQYSLSVNVGRAIPDVRDGLKPGNRRILYAMRQLGLSHGRSYTKCAKVVGEVIGNYHPHGDQAVYDTLVRMAQDFSMRYQLVEGQGNFGSIDGDAAAAYRYTECRMQRLAEELLTDLDKDTVDMRAQARFAMEFCAVESCGKCTPCRIGAVRGVEVLDRLASGEEQDQTLLLDLCDTMEQGSLCAMGGLTPLPVRSALRDFAEDFA